ncbi:MAG: biotin/lipoyl-containing protein, partial [Pseudomonadota bacterium]
AGGTITLKPWQDLGASAAQSGAREVAAPMPGQVIAVHAKAGASVSVGDALIVMEAMKMEHTLTAPAAGVVAAVNVAAGDKVGDGEVLVALEDPSAQR